MILKTCRLVEVEEPEEDSAMQTAVLAPDGQNSLTKIRAGIHSELGKQTGAVRGLSVNTTLLTILPVLGVVVGALLQHWLSRSAENRKQLQSLRRDAYVDYLRAATKVARAKDESELWEAKTLLTDAKTRIAVYGESAVVAALAQCEAVGRPLSSPEGRMPFLALIAGMREVDVARPDDLQLMLLGPDVQEEAAQPAVAADGASRRR